MAIWSRRLSPTEVQQVYSYGADLCSAIPSPMPTPRPALVRQRARRLSRQGTCQGTGCHYDFGYQWSTTECEPGDANYPEGCEAGGGGGKKTGGGGADGAITMVAGLGVFLGCCLAAVLAEQCRKRYKETVAPAPEPRVELPPRCARPAAAPATVRGLRIESVEATEVALVWQGSAISFEVQQRRAGGAWQHAATVRRSRARVSELDAGGAYAFRVRPFGGNWSSEVSARLAAPAPTPEPRAEPAAAPATVRGLRIESVEATEVALVWQGSAISFEVQSRKTGSAWQHAATVRRSQARVGELDAGGAYAFRVRPFGGDWSYEVSARLAAPAPTPEPRAEPAPQAEPAPERSSGTDDCPVCLDRARNTAFIPCGHRTCAECAERISTTAWRGSGPRGDSESRCPVCRQPFTGTLRLY